ncbi:hypothetical protein TNCV_1523041 [Trichonephila clavipes]|nr:hypothetical protein TNCV_1523041 [Trichonephila clavipes]
MEERFAFRFPETSSIQMRDACPVGRQNLKLRYENNTEIKRENLKFSRSLEETRFPAYSILSSYSNRHMIVASCQRACQPIKGRSPLHKDNSRSNLPNQTSDLSSTDMNYGANASMLTYAFLQTQALKNFT